MIELADRFCILRMSGPGTMRVTTSLAGAGFDVWTPVETQVRRLPRSKKTAEREMPVMPTYAFAPADRLRDLLAISAALDSQHPPFSIFRHRDHFPLIAARSLLPLREAEERQREAARRRQRESEPIPTFPAGDLVRVQDGAATGKCGVVIEQKGRKVLVAFPNTLMTWEIDALILVSEMIDRSEPKGTAARAAKAR